MSDRPGTEPCFSCGAVVPETDGPTHEYMLSSPGCWAVYGEVLAREYRDPAYMARHQLTVDAYAVQHPGEPTSSSARRSVHVHLASLCAQLELGLGGADATRLLQRLGAEASEPKWLEPPGDLGDVTVADVHRTRDVQAHLDAVERWARSAWEAWSLRHELVRRRLERVL